MPCAPNGSGIIFRKFLAPSRRFHPRDSTASSLNLPRRHVTGPFTSVLEKAAQLAPVRRCTGRSMRARRSEADLQAACKRRVLLAWPLNFHEKCSFSFVIPFSIDLKKCFEKKMSEKKKKRVAAMFCQSLPRQSRWPVGQSGLTAENAKTHF